MDFSKWPKDDLVRYLEFLIHNYRVMDAFWFINLENDYDLNEACRVNEKVWGKVAQLAARDLKKRFNVQEGGLEGFVKVKKLHPWSLLIGYQYEVEPDQVLIKVPSCATQESRLQYGLEEYPCKAMHMAEFVNFAQEVDPRIKVECLFAPPDEHPPDMFCTWRFTLEE
jgi:hypothetical protein